MTYGLTSERYFKAEETGVFVYPLKGSGEIVSVYSKALNILHADRHLVSVVKAPSQMTSLSLSLPELFSDLKRNIPIPKTGEIVHFQDGRIGINDLHIDLAGGKAWKGALEPREVAGFNNAKIPLLKKALLGKGRKGGLLGLLDPPVEDDLFVRKALKILGGRARTGKRHSSLKGLSQLVGLGIGFTPSGDDFIAGALLGEKIQELVPEDQGGMLPLSIDKNEIRAALKRTNHGGRTLLWQTLHGHFPCYMIEAAKGIAMARESEEVMEVVANASSHGETSGTDALVGLCWYLGTTAEGEMGD